MGTCGAGNFENDSALDYMGEVVDDLEAKIDSILADEDLSALDEEGVLMPTVVMLSLLTDHCHAPSPGLDKVRRWKQQYLAIYDDQIDGFDPTPGHAEARRQVIAETFAKLEAQAVEFDEGMKGAEANTIDDSRAV